MDPDMNMHAVEMTDYQASDIKMMNDLILEAASQLIEKVIAAGAYMATMTARRPELMGS
ncbi:hypothetical protein [Candidatus Paracaedibacter symbiosus]|uniref:hypothetical protein n=1 Tax=Candidatus Paracaedibacter symbiosus TaxID=244582 RepID=UPI0012EC6B68|nr:hypothetical protein [Candidatus Paracaedibacter symbiosus]